MRFWHPLNNHKWKCDIVLKWNIWALLLLLRISLANYRIKISLKRKKKKKEKRNKNNWKGTTNNFLFLVEAKWNKMYGWPCWNLYFICICLLSTANCFSLAYFNHGLKIVVSVSRHKHFALLLPFIRVFEMVSAFKSHIMFKSLQNENNCTEQQYEKKEEKNKTKT